VARQPPKQGDAAHSGAACWRRVLDKCVERPGYAHWSIHLAVLPRQTVASLAPCRNPLNHNAFVCLLEKPTKRCKRRCHGLLRPCLQAFPQTYPQPLCTSRKCVAAMKRSGAQLILYLTKASYAVEHQGKRTVGCGLNRALPESAAALVLALRLPRPADVTLVP
jgi:hypothetical protein